jgi:hypothetical protein
MYFLPIFEHTPQYQAAAATQSAAVFPNRSIIIFTIRNDIGLRVTFFLVQMALFS